MPNNQTKVSFLLRVKESLKFRRKKLPDYLSLSTTYPGEQAVIPQDLEWGDIFVVTDNPTHTYNPRCSLKLEESIREILTGGKLGVITGPTKTGKSVLIKRALQNKTTVWIQGCEIDDENNFWDNILSKLNLYTSSAQNITNGTTDSATVNMGTSFSSPIIPLTPKIEVNSSIGATLATTSTAGSNIGRQLPSKIIVLEHFSRHTSIVLVIDDFHFIEGEVRKKILKALKGSIGNGLPVFVITVPSKKDKICAPMSELIGRIKHIEIPRWSNEELSHIPKTGFKLRGYAVSSFQIDELASRCLGNPLIMQDMCLHLATSHINGNAPKLDYSLPIGQDHIDNTCEILTNNLGKDIYHKLTEINNKEHGPTIDHKRINEVHKATLFSIARLNRNVSHTVDILKLEDLHEIITTFCPETAVTLEEVRNIAIMLSNISSFEHSSVQVVHYRKSTDELEITDPMFEFFLNTKFRK